jgi:hypothetical protein
MNELLKYFEEETNAYKNIYSKNKIIFWGLLLSILTPLIYPIFLKPLKNIIWEYLLLIILMLPSLIMFILFNYLTKRLIKDKYKIKIKTILWNSQTAINDIHNFEKNKISEWLYNKGYYDIEKLNIINNRLNDIKVRKNLNIPVIPVIVGILIFPIWDKFLDIIFSDFELMNDYILMIKYIFIIVLFVLFCIFGICKILNIFWDNIINSDIRSIENLTTIINEIIFDLEINKCNGT